MDPDHAHRGRECYARRAWSEAYEAFAHADRQSPLPAEDVQRFAVSAYLIGRDSEFQQLHERLYRLHGESGDRAPAAQSAFWLALTLLFRGEAGQANAWIARGQQQLQGLDCAARGYLLVPVAEQQLRAGNAADANVLAAEAAALAERFPDPDLRSIARHLQGRALIQQGQILSGLGRLDESMLAVVAGELSPICTGLLYCSVLEACRQVYALGRAQEWTAAFARMCEQQPEMVAFTDTCLVHRAEIMQFRGAWPDAMAEAARACERCAQDDRKPPAAALYQQAEIHRLQGEFAKADEAYRAASDRGCDPQPGLALLRLAQGRLDSASAALKRLLCATTDPLRRASLLPAYLEIMLADGDTAAASGACDELRELAESFDTDVLRGAVAQARGAIALAGKDPAAALDPLRRAFEIWMQLDAPYDAARVRVLIGRACSALGDDDGARLQFSAAKNVFERLGARFALARLSTEEASGTAERDHPLTARELDVLRLISTGSTNKAIAAQLRVSGRTIDRHVGNILRKLDVPSRAAATAYAYDHKLL
ncbi:MAG TPA: LuxR C-terminal-related transcriptional regulator [Steroidobacteraceae bacterium]|jgi:DNA-binding CsgD family transcriptional regulator